MNMAMESGYKSACGAPLLDEEPDGQTADMQPGLNHIESSVFRGRVTDKQE